MPFQPDQPPANQQLTPPAAATVPTAQRQAVGGGFEPAGVADEGAAVGPIGINEWDFQGAGVSVTRQGNQKAIVNISGSGGANGPAGNVQTSDGAGGFSSYAPGTGVTTFNTTPTSANLRAAITDETGTGVAVFNDSPTLAGTPVLSGPGTTTTNNAKGTEDNVNPVNVSTTDATVTTLDSFTLPSNTAVVCSWLVTGVRDTLAEVCAYSVTAAYRNNAGAVSAGTGSPTTVVIAEDDATANATSDNSGTTIRLRVAGPAAKNYTWTAVRTSLQVIP
jgi:hypothetical protein